MATDNKVALITGANKGLGLEIARQLGQQGITVVVGARDEARGTTAAETLISEGIDAHFVKLDVTNQEDVAALPDYLEEKFGRLDILVNNAGVGLDRQGLTPEMFRQTYEANVIAPFFLTHALIPLLTAAPSGRVVNHSSILGSITVISDPNQISTDWLGPAYNSSKAALNMLTVIQSRQLAGTRIKVNAAHPGWVKTDMGGQEAALEIPDGAKTAVMLATLPDDGPTGGFFHNGQPLPW